MYNFGVVSLTVYIIGTILLFTVMWKFRPQKCWWKELPACLLLSIGWFILTFIGMIKELSKTVVRDE